MRLAVWSAGAAALLVAACGSEANTPTAEMPVESAHRIVALTSLSADIVHHLDAERLVGIPGSSLFQGRPEFADIAVVSQGRTPPQLETIVALEPDLVIGAQGFHDEALAQLEANGIATLATETHSWEDFIGLTETLAAFTGGDAATLEPRYRSCLEPGTGGPSVVALVSRQPLLSPNADSWAGHLLERFNLENLTADVQGQSPIEGYVTLSGETVLASDPEALILVDVGEDIVEQLKAEPFWGELKAVEAEQVYVFEYHGLVNPGSLDSIDAACRQLQQLADS